MDSIDIVTYKPFNECTSDEQKLQLAVLDSTIGGHADFWNFLSWCRILSTPTISNSSGLFPFKVLPHNKEFIKALLSKRLISLMKSRQIWCSYTVIAYCLWFAMSKQGANIMLFSVREPESQELLAKGYRIYRYLPPIMKLAMKPDSSEAMGFTFRESMIKAFPSTETAGVSYTASIIVCDEHVEHEYDTQNYLSAKPTIDSVGGQFISIFTPNKMKLNKLAFSLWRNAPDNGFTPLFFPFNVLPERDEVWYSDKKNNLTSEELHGLTPELYMESNYPKSVEEALRAPQNIRAFDGKVIDDMMSVARQTPKVQKNGVDNLVTNIYREYYTGARYIAATDTSHGGGRDYAVTAVMEVNSGAIVADVFSNVIPPEELAMHSVKLLKLYQEPKWFIEDNEWGRVTISAAQGLGYTNFGYRDDKKTQIGFHTDEKTRFDLWGELIPAVNSHQISIFNPKGVTQFYDIIRNIEKNGRIEAPQTRHDDYPIAVGICWLKRKEAQSANEKIKIIRTLDF